MQARYDAIGLNHTLKMSINSINMQKKNACITLILKIGKDVHNFKKLLAIKESNRLLLQFKLKSILRSQSRGGGFF